MAQFIDLEKYKIMAQVINIWVGSTWNFQPHPLTSGIGGGVVLEENKHFKNS